MGRRPKVTIVGAGAVGHTAAHWLAVDEVAALVLGDIIEKMPMGKALDLQQSAPIRGVDVSIVGSNGYAETEGSDLVVIIAGIARKPGMTREQLIDTNAGIVRSVRERVIGESGALDGTRFRTFIAKEVGVSIADVHGIVIGAHTDKDMVPLSRFAHAGGGPLIHFVTPARVGAT